MFCDEKDRCHPNPRLILVFWIHLNKHVTKHWETYIAAPCAQMALLRWQSTAHSLAASAMQQRLSVRCTGGQPPPQTGQAIASINLHCFIGLQVCPRPQSLGLGVEKAALPAPLAGAPQACNSVNMWIHFASFGTKILHLCIHKLELRLKAFEAPLKQGATL